MILLDTDVMIDVLRKHAPAGLGFKRLPLRSWVCPVWW